MIDWVDGETDGMVMEWTDSLVGFCLPADSSSRYLFGFMCAILSIRNEQIITETWHFESPDMSGCQALLGG